jgi:hypothetical protein
MLPKSLSLKQELNGSTSTGSKKNKELPPSYLDMNSLSDLGAQDLQFETSLPGK